MMATSGTMAMNPTLYKALPAPGKDLLLADDLPFRWWSTTTCRSNRSPTW